MLKNTIHIIYNLTKTQLSYSVFNIEWECILNTTAQPRTDKFHIYREFCEMKIRKEKIEKWNKHLFPSKLHIKRGEMDPSFE